jgi:hypothetical protein
VNESEILFDEDDFTFDEDDNTRLMGPRGQGESYLAELDCQANINRLVEKLTQLRAATDKREAREPTDKNLPRARNIIDQLETELWGWLHAYLAVWRPNRRKPN